MAKNNYVVLFFTQYGAIGYARLLSEEGIENETRPVPRSLSSSCGVSVSFALEADKDVRHYVTEEVERIYRDVDGAYTLVYENEE